METVGYTPGGERGAAGKRKHARISNPKDVSKDAGALS